MNNKSHIILKKTLACSLVYLIPILVIVKNILVRYNIKALENFLILSVDILQFLLPYILLILLIKARAKKDVRGVELAVIFLMIILNYLLIDNHLYLNIVNINSQNEYHQIIDVFNGLWLLLLISYFAVLYGSHLALKDINNEFYNSLIKIFLLFIASIVLIVLIDYGRLALLNVLNNLGRLSFLASQVQIFLIATFDKLLVIFKNIYDGSDVFNDVMFMKIFPICQNKVSGICSYNADFFTSTEIFNNLLLIPGTCYLFFSKMHKENKQTGSLFFGFISILAFVFGFNQLFYLFLFFTSKRLLLIFSLLNGLNSLVIVDFTNVNYLNATHGIMNMKLYIDQHILNYMSVVQNGLIFGLEYLGIYLLLKKTNLYTFGVNEIISFDETTSKQVVEQQVEQVIESETIRFLSIIKLELVQSVELNDKHQIILNTKEKFNSNQLFSDFTYLSIQTQTNKILISNADMKICHHIYSRIIEYHYNIILEAQRENENELFITCEA